jgi:3-hydroxyisobutyrate dehydrogenase
VKELKLGWIGLGNMGTPIAENLLKAGYSVTVFNRTRDKEKELIAAGATSGDSPHQLMQNCGVIFTMVSDDAAVKSVFEGDQGLLTKAIPGKLIINMSTVSPETSRYLAKICNQQKVEFLEAPVSGSVKQAQDRTLIILAGGDAGIFQKAKPCFEAIGKLTIYFGENGKASSAKLAINYLVALTVQALAETVLFATKSGVRKEDIITLINESALASPMIKVKVPSILNNSYPAAFALKLMAKDLRLVKQTGLESPLFEPVYNSFQQAEIDGLGEEDLMAIIKFLEKFRDSNSENDLMKGKNIMR